MAALYLHNAIFTPDPSESSLGLAPHARNISTVSTGTLRTITSGYSYPTEPLLHSATSESLTYLDLLNNQPPYPNGPHPGQDMRLNLDGDPTTMTEMKGRWEKTVRRRLRRLRLIKASLEVVMGAWATYNTVRYFLAYAVYSSTNGQMVSLALGTSTTLSIALLLSATILSIFGPFLLLCHYPIRSLLVIRTTLHYLSSFFLFGPAVVSLAFVFVWRHSPDPEVTLGGRCRLDIDVIWSVTSANCRPSAWSTWLALSIIRVVTTLAIIIIYHIASSAYHNIRRPSQQSQRRHLRRRHRHRLNPSESTNHPSLVSPEMTGSGVSTLSPISTLPLSHQHRVSHFSLVSNANSRQTSERRSLRSSRASSLRRPPSVNSNSARINRMSGLSDSSSEDISGDEAYNRLPPNLQQRANIENSPSPNSTEGDRDIHNFVDRFRSLVSQITRETEDGLEFADESTSSLPIASSSTTDFGKQYKPPSLPAPALGYDEFGRPYPPEENVRILNGIIRRMPTIESMGSREVGSVAGSNWGHDRMTSSKSIQSHPPTRANTLDHTGSESLSRSNSLSIAHGFIDEMGEVGEFAEERGERRNVRRMGSGSTRTGSSGTTGTGASHPSVSRSTTSYHTATSSGSPWQSVNVSAGHSGPDTEESAS